MTIAMVGSYPPPDGGQAVHIRNLSRFLRERGVDVRVLNTGANKQLREDGVVNIAGSRSLLAALLGGRFGLVHVHVSAADDYGKLAPVACAAIVARLPWVVTIHSGDSARRLRQAGRLRRLVSRALIAGARRVICVNGAIRDELSTLVGRDRAIVIPPASIDFRAGPVPAEIEPFIAAHAPLVTCIGLHRPVYGFDTAVAALADLRARFPRAGLILIGDPKDAERTRQQVVARGLARDVLLCGNLPNEACLAVVARSSLFLRPTLFDGDSLSVRDALALGVPVVASPTDFRPEGIVLYKPDVAGDLVSTIAATLETARPPAPGAVADHRNLDRVRRVYEEIAA